MTLSGVALLLSASARSDASRRRDAGPAGGGRGDPPPLGSVGFRLVLREDAVERAPCFGEHLGCLGSLRLAARVHDLLDRDPDLHHQLAELADPLGHALAGERPGRAELLPVLVDVAAAGVGQLEEVRRRRGFRSGRGLRRPAAGTRGRPNRGSGARRPRCVPRSPASPDSRCGAPLRRGAGSRP